MITFRRLAETDLVLLHRWLETPHVRAHWSDEPRTLDAIAASYLPMIRGDDPTHAFVALVDDVPVGYLQTYRIDDNPDYARHIDVGADAAGVDMLIGEPAYVHRGRGAELLRRFVDEIVWSVTSARSCWIGPAIDNTIAIRAYEKAGFIYQKTIEVPGERLPEYLMVLTR